MLLYDSMGLESYIIKKASPEGKRTDLEILLASKEVVYKAIHKAEKVLVDDVRELKFQEGNVQCTIRLPHERAAKHGSVYMLDLVIDGVPPFSCVAKQDVDSARLYMEWSSVYPEITKHVPRVLAVDEDYFFMEKLHGLELKSLVKKLESDEIFLHEYAKKSYELIETLARNGLLLDDVKFASGHNCMVDPVSADVSCVEVASIRPKDVGVMPRLDSSVESIIVEQIFSEIWSLGANPSDSSCKVIYQLLKHMLARIPQAQCVLKRKVVMPSHETYRTYEQDAFDLGLEPMYMWGFKEGDTPGIMPMESPIHSKALRLEAIDAIMTGNIDRFIDLFRKKAIIEEGDETDIIRGS